MPNRTDNWLQPRQWWVVVLVPVALVVSAGALRVLLLGDPGPDMPYLLLYPAVALAALYGGIVSGLFATVLAVALAHAGVRHGVMAPIPIAVTVIFFASGILISAIAEAMRRANRRARLARVEAEQASALAQRQFRLYEGLRG